MILLSKKEIIIKRYNQLLHRKFPLRHKSSSFPFTEKVKFKQQATNFIKNKKCCYMTSVFGERNGRHAFLRVSHHLLPPSSCIFCPHSSYPRPIHPVMSPHLSTGLNADGLKLMKSGVVRHPESPVRSWSLFTSH